MLNIFSCACWPSVFLLWKNVCSDPLPFFTKSPGTIDSWGNRALRCWAGRSSDCVWRDARSGAWCGPVLPAASTGAARPPREHSALPKLPANSGARAPKAGGVRLRLGFRPLPAPRSHDPGHFRRGRLDPGLAGVASTASGWPLASGCPSLSISSSAWGWDLPAWLHEARVRGGGPGWRFISIRVSRPVHTCIHPYPLPWQQERRDPLWLASRLVHWSELFPTARVTYCSLTQWPLQHLKKFFFFLRFWMPRNAQFLWDVFGWLWCLILLPKTGACSSSPLAPRPVVFYITFLWGSKNNF